MKNAGTMYKVAGLALVALTAGLVIADSWAAPKKEHWSSSKQFVLRVDNKAKTLSLKEDTGSGLTTNWQIKFPQHNAPYQAFVTQDGSNVVLFDVHANLGYGKVLVFLNNKGEVVKSYKLDGFLTKSEIEGAIHSVSSIWWSEYELRFLDEERKRLQFVTSAGTVYSFDMQTGKKLKPSTKEIEQIKAKGVAKANKYLESDDPAVRQRGERLAKFIREKV